MNLDHYRNHAGTLCQQYDRLDPAGVHQSWIEHLPTEAGFALDLGAGSGRDANWLAGLGWDVIAVEPCDEMRQLAAANYPHPSIQWLNDALPELKQLRQLGQRFNLILVSAVWMHLPPKDRERALRIVSELLAPGGLLVITLRQGPDDGRGFYTVPPEELLEQARKRALALVAQSCVADMHREELSWCTVVLGKYDQAPIELTRSSTL
jgi:SAM-dependent methyltransferase